MKPNPVLLVLAGLLTAACNDTDFYTGAFEGPTAAAVALPGATSPFSDPVGFVANRHGGQIAILALADGRFQTDDQGASFVRGNPLATGHQRILAEIATYTRDGALSVFAGDLRYSVLLEVPYVVSISSGEPIESTATATEPVFTDADSSGDSPNLNSLMVQAGHTATEDWTLLYQDGSWWVTGSRSGRLESPALSGQAFEDESGVLSFEITGSATNGDFFSFSSDSGLIEHDVGGSPIHLLMSSDQETLAMVIEDPATSKRTLVWRSPVEATQITVTLPSDARPGRMGWSEDGQTLYVSDAARAAVWSVPVGDTEAEEIPLPWPTRDVAALDQGPSPSLFLVPEDNRSVWRYDLSAGALVDLNVETPQVDGLALDTFVQGLSAIPVEYNLAVNGLDGETRPSRSVAISLYSGPVVFLDEETGCLHPDALGPRTLPSSDFGANYDYGTNFEGATGPFLQENGANNRHIIVNPCTGIAQTEFWTLTFDENVQGWEVEGSTTGVQSEWAHEDKRYVTEDGALSFVIRSGSTPSADSQTFRFSVDAGVLKADGDNDKDGQITEGEFSMSLPSEPVFFTMGDEAKAMLLVASGSGNFVTRVNPAEATFDIIWE